MDLTRSLREAAEPFITPDLHYALPPWYELATSMEALIYHFKPVAEGFRVPPGECYVADLLASLAMLDPILGGIDR